MCTRLLDLKSETEGELNDGKSPRGHNRLTVILKPKIQRCNSMAIRNNINDLNSMKTSVWDVYFHLLSSEMRAFNMDCILRLKSPGASFKRQKMNVTKNIMIVNTYTIMNEIKPIFRALGDPMSLKCLYGTHRALPRIQMSQFITPYGQ
ncbi:hypothetical protein TNCV_4832331 [Trichonephila clavipes]|nr:hypothetical protein TNCV_4832331 [Trichonephila clavipes]